MQLYHVIVNWTKRPPPSNDQARPLLAIPAGVPLLSSSLLAATKCYFA